MLQLRWRRVLEVGSQRILRLINFPKVPELDHVLGLVAVALS